jgi:hypothetical protein
MTTKNCNRASIRGLNQKEIETIGKKIGITSRTDIVKYSIKYTYDHVTNPLWEAARQLYPTTVERRIENARAAD